MTRSTPHHRRGRNVAAAIGAAVLALLVALILFLNFGWGLLRPAIERRASAALGRPVAIGRIGRAGGGLLDPVLAIEGVRIAQPAWAGAGDMLRLRAARVRVAVLPLLVGSFRPHVTLVDGLRADLIRREDGQGNWEKDGAQDRTGSVPDLGQLVVRDAFLSIDDRQHQHRFRVKLTIDDGGLLAAGGGDVGGTPAQLVLRGAPVRGSQPWPFSVRVRSAAVMFDAAGTMRTPLDFAHFTGHVAANGQNLRDLDHLIEAGLFDTQPFRLKTAVEHDGKTWKITRLSGTLGRSDVAGSITIMKQEGRTHLDGGFTSRGFDLDDLATDAQQAQAAALKRRLGPRLFPATKIDLSKLRRVDGTVRIDVRRLLSREGSAFRSAKGTLTLDHGVLTAPFTAGMAAGTLAGSLVIRHQSGRPLLIADLRLANSRLEQMVRTNGIASGPLQGRMRVRGYGETFREAMGVANGRVALVTRNGVVTRRVALLLGADVGRGIFAGNRETTGLRCLIGAFAVTHGIARPDPVVIDTDVARADGSGMVDFADERVALDLYGRPKKDSVLRLNGPIEARGTIEDATLNPPPQTKSVGGILKMVGRALGGNHAPLATDANCSALAAAALR